ncbi:MAG TPA: DUF1501 domain-containing protein [Bryobacteraceae bacterium]|nr:DUF1501 domain-containing protein [Bryobacteraceae bacterium]
MPLSRREFIASSVAAASLARAEKIAPKADSVIYIWLPGGMAQTDLWDPKKFTPYTAGMKGSEVLGTCDKIPTSADGIFLGAGLDKMAAVMNRGAILRTLSSETKFGAVHLKAQYYANTGYLFPSGVKAPSIGSIVSRTLGRKNQQIPAYIYIGRDVDTSDEEKLFISEYIGPGFYGVNHAPFMIPDPAKGLATLNAVAGMKMDRLDRRQQYLEAITGLSQKSLLASNKASDYMKVMEDARAMMDSPVKRAFDYKTDEKPELLAAYEPEIAEASLLDPTYYNGNRFSHGLLLARRLVEAGARFIQVEYQYGPFKGFDMHENGRQRMVEMKKQIDRPIARLIQDLDERGLLDRTLVVIASEFGRTIASAPAAGQEADGFAERNTGENLVIENEKMYGFHGHFSSCSCMLFFGGGFKKGYVHGRTADRHPMEPVENPVPLIDAYATIFKALGIPADTNYVTEGRPFYVTNNGKGRAVDALLS